MTTTAVQLDCAQAELQRRLFEQLRERGVPVRRPPDVYGWLLDQVAAELRTAEREPTHAATNGEQA